MAPKLTLYYFDSTGRAEPARLLFTIGGVPFEDKRLTKEQWAEFKPKTPFGQMPVLEIDGKMIAQSGAIYRYAASVAGLFPSDPLAIALNEQASGLCKDALDLLIGTMSIQDDAEKVKARKALLEGGLKERLQQLSKLIEGTTTEWISGSKISYGDLEIQNLLHFLTSGYLDGIPTDIVDTSYPTLKAFLAKVLGFEPIKKYYEARAAK